MYNSIYLVSISDIGRTLSQVMKGIWDVTLGPMLEISLYHAFVAIKLIFEEILSEFLYKVSVMLLKIIELFEHLVEFFLGINSFVDKDGERVSLIESVFKVSDINKFMWVFIVISFLLTFLLVFRRMFSVITADDRDQKPFNTIFKEFMKCWYRIGLMSFYCILFLKIVSVGTLTLSYLTQSYSSSISNTVFVLVAKEHIKRDGTDIISDYMNPENKTRWYDKESQVENDFNIKKINYLALVALCFFSALIFVSLLLKLSRRIFNIVILYLIGPFFAVMSVIKDEERQYQKWQSMYVSNFINVFFPMLGFYLFNFIVTQFINSNIVFYSDNEIINSVMTVCFFLALLEAIPNSMSFGYNLITDQGRFLASESLSLSEIMHPISTIFN